MNEQKDDTLKELETTEVKLHSSELRKDISQLTELLSEMFIEFGTSGKRYNKKDIINRLPDQEHININSYDFESRFLSKSIVQIIYKTKIILNDAEITALRSSLWKKEQDKWHMIFHQSTQLKFD